MARTNFVKRLTATAVAAAVYIACATPNLVSIRSQTPLLDEGPPTISYNAIIEKIAENLKTSKNCMEAEASTKFDGGGVQCIVSIRKKPTYAGSSCIGANCDEDDGKEVILIGAILIPFGSVKDIELRPDSTASETDPQNSNTQVVRKYGPLLILKVGYLEWTSNLSGSIVKDHDSYYKLSFEFADMQLAVATAQYIKYMHDNYERRSTNSNFSPPSLGSLPHL